MRVSPAFAPLYAVLAAMSLVPISSTASAREVDWDQINLPAERAAIARFQLADQRLQDVGWKLVHGNAEFCERVVPSIGLQLQDLASYGSPEVARAALAMQGDFAVQTAARGSPSGAAQIFSANREVSMVGQFDPNSFKAADNRLHWQRLTSVHNYIEAYLAGHGTIAVGFADGEAAQVSSVDVCATRFELMGDGRRAVADGNRVVIGMEFPAFAYEEDVFAGVVAHELAHNLLGHSVWLDRNGRRMRNVRRTEREADRLMPWILANAGYDPAAAQQFMEEWGPRHDGGLFRDRSHDGWDERAAFIAAEIPRIRDLMEREGKADWSVHFRREIDPRAGLVEASGD